jgi:hypothetical protein
MLLVIDSTRVTYLFPNRYPKDGFSWDGVLEGSLETISEIILRDLADAGYLTIDRHGRRIYRRPVRLDKKTCCPKCGALGSIKRYFFGKVGDNKFAMRLAKDRVVLGRSRMKGDPEAVCMSCGWTGSTEIFRFVRKGV